MTCHEASGAMTAASRFAGGSPGQSERLRGFTQTAQPLHNGTVMGACARAVCWMSLFTATACVVPIPATPEEGDAGPLRDTPVIEKGSPDFPGPLTLPGTQNVTLTLRDFDLRDTLYLRVFKNYRPDNVNSGLGALPPVGNDPVNGTARRIAPVPTNLWCTGSAGQQVVITIVVADEMFDDTGAGDFPFKTPLNGGRWSERNFVVSCSQ
jgi:hypothetical protein